MLCSLLQGYRCPVIHYQGLFHIPATLIRKVTQCNTWYTFANQSLPYSSKYAWFHLQLACLLWCLISILQQRSSTICLMSISLFLCLGIFNYPPCLSNELLSKVLLWSEQLCTTYICWCIPRSLQGWHWTWNSWLPMVCWSLLSWSNYNNVCNLWSCKKWCMLYTCRIQFYGYWNADYTPKTI